MKRACDFRQYTESLHSLEESVSVLPDLPEGCGLDYLERVLDRHPIAESLYDPSDFRKNGLKIWDSVYLPLPSVVSLGLKNVRDLATLRNINDRWETTKEALCMQGRPDGIHTLRPKDDYVLDMLREDVRILQGAHILTHRTHFDYVTDDYTFGQTSDIFLRNLIRLFLARKYELPICVHPEMSCPDAFSVYGFEVFGSTELRAPTLFVPTDKLSGRINPDHTVVSVLGSVGIEAHPKNAVNDTDWHEFNRWSCMPTLITLSGWEGIDYVTHAERTEIGGAIFYGVPCTDLQPMSRFDEVIDDARRNRSIPPSDSVMTVEAWIDSDDFKIGLSNTPQLPCPHCLRLNRNADGVVRRPRSRKPKAPLAEIRQSAVPELKEWVKYVDFMQNCITIGRKATAYALGSVTKLHRRNTNFKRKVETLRKIQGFERRYRRKLDQGFLSEASALLNKINCLKNTVR